MTLLLTTVKLPLTKFKKGVQTMKNKLPKELDPQEVFNIIHRTMWETMTTGKTLANDTSLTVEKRLESVTHLSARICGMCDVLNALGYEIRDEQGLLVTAKISLFGTIENLRREIARQQKGVNTYGKEKENTCPTVR